MKLQSPATPMILLVGLTLLFLGAIIDLVGNTLYYSYKLLEPIFCEIWVFTLESLSCWLVSTGDRLQRYFYQVDNSSGSLPSVIDAFWCTALVDLGRLMKYLGRVIKTAFE